MRIFREGKIKKKDVGGKGLTGSKLIGVTRLTPNKTTPTQRPVKGFLGRRKHGLHQPVKGDRGQTGKDTRCGEVGNNHLCSRRSRDERPRKTITGNTAILEWQKFLGGHPQTIPQDRPKRHLLKEDPPTHESPKKKKG